MDSDRSHTLLTLGRLAYALDLPRDWLREQAESGRIPCLRVGRKMLFDREAVERALSEMAATGSA